MTDQEVSELASISVQEFAELMGCTESKVYKLRSENRTVLPDSFKFCGQVRFRLSAVRDWINKLCQKEHQFLQIKFAEIQLDKTRRPLNNPIFTKRRNPTTGAYKSVPADPASAGLNSKGGAAEPSIRSERSEDAGEPRRGGVLITVAEPPTVGSLDRAESTESADSAVDFGADSESTAK